MWTVIIGKPVQRRLSRIPNPDRERLTQAIKDLETKPEQMDIKPLTGRGEYRLRVGDWRFIMKINEDEKIIRLRSLGSRGDVYKK
ncbi:MAG: type II toxin-antitoxin system RelE/ParE family toxin [Synergistaceae bacterium]|nr:type II toxin-antitoxin system RelE/ParE family toxin [Synergistaceae bacterium]